MHRISLLRFVLTRNGRKKPYERTIFFFLLSFFLRFSFLPYFFSSPFLFFLFLSHPFSSILLSSFSSFLTHRPPDLFLNNMKRPVSEGSAATVPAWLQPLRAACWKALSTHRIPVDESISTFCEAKDLAQLPVRSAADVAKRLCILIALQAVATVALEELSRTPEAARIAISWLKDQNLWSLCDEDERYFLQFPINEEDHHSHLVSTLTTNTTTGTTTTVSAAGADEEEEDHVETEQETEEEKETRGQLNRRRSSRDNTTQPQQQQGEQQPQQEEDDDEDDSNDDENSSQGSEQEEEGEEEEEEEEVTEYEMVAEEMQWRTESAFVLMWLMGITDALPWPVQPALILPYLKDGRAPFVGQPVDAFLSGARIVRERSELAREAELMHVLVTTVDKFDAAEIDTSCAEEEVALESVVAQVALERLHALRWALGLEDWRVQVDEASLP
jgi:hypothetical protein